MADYYQAMLNFKLSDGALHYQDLPTGRMVSVSAHVSNICISTTCKIALLQQPLNWFELNIVYQVPMILIQQITTWVSIKILSIKTTLLRKVGCCNPTLP